MKLSHLPLVHGLIGERRQLLDALGQLTERKLAITIDGLRQDEAIIALVIPVLTCELKARVAKLDRELEAHQVEIA